MLHAVAINQPQAYEVGPIQAEHESEFESEIVVRLRTGGCFFAEDEARLLLAAQVSPTERAA